MEVVRVPGVGGQRKQVVAGGFPTIVRSYRSADVVHHHDPRFLFETSLAMRGLTSTPLIFHTHGLILHTDAYATAKRVLMRWYYGPALERFVDVVVADSEGDAVLLYETTGRQFRNVRVVRNAVDLSGFARIADRTEPGTVLTWGRLDRHKGIARLLDVVSRLPDSVRLTVAGSGPPAFLGELQQRAVALGLGSRITWAGRVSIDDLHGLLAQAAVVVFPSEFEGFGIALVEAMAAGRPVVASDIPTHREILGAAHARWLTDFTPQSGAHVMRDALALGSSERAELRTSLRRRAAEFDLERLVDDIAEIHRELDVVSS